MRVLIFGLNGMLGHKLAQRWASRFEVHGTLRGDVSENLGASDIRADRVYGRVDVRDEERVRYVVREAAPDVIVNAAGIVKQAPQLTNLAETLEVNSIFPHRLAAMAVDVGARLISFSTDCVFTGVRGLYAETDAPDALDLYGLSKRFGEVTDANCLTIRTSILGPEIGTSQGLLEWFLSNEGGTVKGYRRAVFSGFPTVVMADIIGDVIERFPNLSGLYHVSSAQINKFTLLSLICDAYRAHIGIQEDDMTVIDRSLDSSRFRAVTGFVPRPWPEMIAAMAADDERHFLSSEH